MKCYKCSHKIKLKDIYGWIGTYIDSCKCSKCGALFTGDFAILLVCSSWVFPAMIIYKYMDELVFFLSTYFNDFAVSLVKWMLICFGPFVFVFVLAYFFVLIGSSGFRKF